MELVLKNKYKIQNLNEGISLKESIDGIAYTMDVNLVETQELKDIGIAKGDSIHLYDYEFSTHVIGQQSYTKVFDGIIWDINKSRKTKKITITGKERTFRIEESEDEYIFPEGETALQHAVKLCNDWGIPLGLMKDPGIGLAKAVHRKETIFGIMLKDLKETAQKGGSLYKYRMEDKLNLFELRTNHTIWKMESIADDIQEKSSLQGAITQVKVLGKNEKDEDKAPVIGTYSKDTDKYGTIQKILQDDKVTNNDEAKKKADTMFSSGEDNIKINCVKDINTIRAGDKISLDGVYYYVTDITHNLGSVGKMDMTVMSWEGVKKKFYGD